MKLTKNYDTSHDRRTEKSYRWNIQTYNTWNNRSTEKEIHNTKPHHSLANPSRTSQNPSSIHNYTTTRHKRAYFSASSSRLSYMSPQQTLHLLSASDSTTPCIHITSANTTLALWLRLHQALVSCHSYSNNASYSGIRLMGRHYLTKRST